MRLKMLRQFTNARTQYGNLDFRRPGIRVVSTVLVNQGGFFSLGLTLLRVRSYSVLVVCCYVIKNNTHSRRPPNPTG